MRLPDYCTGGPCPFEEWVLLGGLEAEAAAWLAAASLGSSLAA